MSSSPSDLFPQIQLDAVSHFPQSWRIPLLQFAQVSPVPIDQLFLISCMILTMPLGYIHSKLPSATIKHIYSTFLGMFFAYLLFGKTIYYTLASILITYSLVQVLPLHQAPTVVWIFSMAYLSVGHIVRANTDYSFWSLEFTMCHMLVTVKQITFAYNYLDGVLLRQGVKELHPNPVLHQFRAECALTAGLPSLLEWLSFHFFFAGVLVGPCFELREYLEFTDLTMFRKHNLSSIPSPWRAVFKSLGWALLCYVGVAASAHFPIIGFTATPVFADYSLATKLTYLFIGLSLCRFKFYFAWHFAEAGCIATGFGFNGIERSPDGKQVVVRWDRLNNIDLVKCEFGESIPVLLNGWNKQINRWLKCYIYQRMQTPDWLRKHALVSDKAFANVAAKFTSAFWHGFEPGYYLFFLSAYLSQRFDDEFKRLVRPLFYRDAPVIGQSTSSLSSSSSSPSSTDPDASSSSSIVSEPRLPCPLMLIYHLLAWFQVHFTLNYFGIGFILLEAGATFAVWRSVFFFGHILVAALLILAALIPSRRRLHRSETKMEASKTQ